MVTDDQSMASMLNKHFSSVFNTTSRADTSNTNSNNTNYLTSSASVDRQDAMTQHSNNNYVSASNNTEYPHVPGHQNCLHDYTLQNLEITTEDVLNTLNDMKSNKSPRTDNIYPIILKETKDEIAGALAHLFNMSPSTRIRPWRLEDSECHLNLQERQQKHTWELQAHKFDIRSWQNVREHN